jgi:hypothetical protein
VEREESDAKRHRDARHGKGVHVEHSQHFIDVVRQEGGALENQQQSEIARDAERQESQSPGSAPPPIEAYCNYVINSDRAEKPRHEGPLSDSVED